MTPLQRLFVVLLSLLLSGLAPPVVPEHCRLSFGRSAAAAENWKNEFEEICAYTGNATVLTKDELRVFIGRCDRLEPAIAKLDDTERKVFGRRLKMCRDLYAYVLAAMEAREQK